MAQVDITFDVAAMTEEAIKGELEILCEFPEMYQSVQRKADRGNEVCIEALRRFHALRGAK